MLRTSFIAFIFMHLIAGGALVTAQSDYYASAYSYYEQGELESAIIEVQNALQQDPENILARILSARIYLEMNAVVSAEASLLRVRSMGADPNLYMALLGAAWLELSKFDALLAEDDLAPLSPTRKAEWLVLRGKAFIAKGEPVAARQELEKASRILPASASPYVAMSLLSVMERQLDAAQSEIDRALELEPQSNQALKQQGDLYRSLGEMEKALSYYDKILEIAPTLWNVRQSRAVTLIDLGRGTAALEELEYILAITPTNPRALFTKATVLAKLNNSVEALAILEDLSGLLVEEAVAGDYQLELILGVTLFLQGKNEQARRYLETIHRSQPGRVPIRQMLTDLYYREEDYAEVLDLYSSVDRVAESDQKATFQYASSGWQLDQTAEVEFKLEQWKESTPSLAYHLAQLRATTMLDRGRQDEAMALLQELREQNFEEPSINSLLMLGRIQVERNMIAAARWTADEMVGRFPFDPRSYNYACLLEKGQGRIEAAIEYCGRALAVDAQYVPAAVNLSLIQMEKGNLEAAEKGFQAVLTVYPVNAESLQALMYMAEQRDDITDALRMSERLVAYHPNVPEYRQAKARLQIAMGDPGQALKTLEYFGTGNPAAAQLRAVASIALGANDKAAAQLRKLHLEYKEDPDKLAVLTRQQLSVGAFEDAERTISDIERVSGYAVLAQQLTADAYRLSGRFDDCIRYIGQFPPASLSSAMTILQADCLVASGDHQAASATLAKALESAPSEQLMITWVLLQVDSNRSLTLQRAQEFLANHPDSPRLLKVVADQLLMTRPQESIAIYERLLNHYPELPQQAVYNNLANLYMQAGGKMELALEYARKAHGLSPDSPLIADTYGWALVENGRPGEGLPLLRKAYARNSLHPEVNYHLAIALAMLGKGSEARSHAKNVSAEALTPEQSQRLASSTTVTVTRP
ncbi:MAG: PEP-CTERM system TPR-repeat protein PrsT [Halioglobus sp.]|nr:PEP-CTERM system TPR-repeat protein PrsT [Halioglobus sp.]